MGSLHERVRDDAEGDATVGRAAAMREDIAACVARCRAVDVHAFEHRGVDAARALLVPVVLAEALEARAICRRAMEAFDAERQDDDDDANTSVDPTVEIADLAFVAASELRPTVDLLTNTGRMDEGELFEVCRRAIGRTLKVLTALDAVLARVSRTETARFVGDELARSMATRRHYARVRRMICGFETPVDASSARRGLERVRVHVALLVRSDTYAHLRRTDRHQLDDLASRIAETLAQRDDAEACETRLRLWQDLQGFARLIVAINRRQELVESDTSIVDAAHTALTEASSMPPKLRAQLDLLSGLDDDVDRLLEASTWDPAAWRPVLRVLHDRLVRPATGRFVIRKELTEPTAAAR